ncbi:MAG: STAS domain-containing protein [Candidatus Auribacterota bacterium]|jgi:anti-anti-sigma factor|nr:STAS domain-containing protein [Candidatus Auribacterota bacterium]
MGFKINRNDNIVVLTVLDDVILDTIEEFRNVIHSLIEENVVYVVLDVSSVEFISSRGLGVIGYAMDAMRKHGGDLKILGMKPEVKAIFDICGLSQIIEMYDSQDDAVLSCGNAVSNVEKRLLWSIKPKE